MQSLFLSDLIAAQITAHAQESQPNEACGLLVGQGNVVHRAIPVMNEAQDPRHFFEITQKTLNAHLPAIRANQLTLIGFYHAHPRGLPYPSEYDRVHLAPFNLAHVIVGLRDSSPRLAAWWIGQGGAHAVELVLDVRHTTDLWTVPQKNAMIVSVLISVLLLIALSLILLPPAP